MVNIRNATEQDAKSLAYIQTESWKSAFRGILSEGDLVKHTELDKTEAMYGQVLQNPNIRVLLETVSGKPHCMAAWGPNRAVLGVQTAELICIHSLPDKWRQGYGSMMMDRILADMREAGFSEVMLWVFEQNQRARKFYEKHGFSLTERTQNGFGAVELMYSRKL
ncbi:MAG: GNAT family N-acetyltransferase [Eubacteriales bacterium]|nr:GNAT family N-acetyltransferase [Eubacteriales bacterium]